MFRLETMLSKDPHIESAIVFGSGQSQCGILIQPKHGYMFDPSDISSLNTFRDTIWYVSNSVYAHLVLYS